MLKKKKKKKEGREEKIRNIIELGLKVEEGRVKEGEKEDEQKMENIKKKETKERKRKFSLILCRQLHFFYFISEIEFNLK